MSTNTKELSNAQEQLSVKSLFGKDEVKRRFGELLGKKAPGFITSVLQVVNNSKLLSKADPNTILSAAATAAALDLPINQNLGYAWIIPFNENKKVNGQWQKRCVAQFQIGWKGYVQLALRTAQYKRINVTEVFENQFKSYNKLTEELEADFSVNGEGKPVGYVAYFALTNGFEKTGYWSLEEVTKHADRYSQTYNKTPQNSTKLIKSPWNDEGQFDAMAKKTVLKNTLSKWGIMSIEMQTAQMSDQSVQPSEGIYTYPDNEPVTIDITKDDGEEEITRIRDLVKMCKDEPSIITLENELYEQGKLGLEGVQDLIDAKKETFFGDSEKNQEATRQLDLTEVQ